MSASGRLEALDLGPGFIDDAELSVMGYDGLLALRDALPELIAVVEAAETYVRVDAEHTRRISTADVESALAALDAKLTTKGER